MKHTLSAILMATTITACVEEAPPPKLERIKNYDAENRFPSAFVLRNEGGDQLLICKQAFDAKDQTNDRRVFAVDIDPKTTVALSERGTSFYCKGSLP